MLRGVRSLRIQLLGSPVVEVDGTALSVDTRKALAMLAFLAVTGHGHSRAVIADLLWPELDGERASGVLRRTLSTLRGALGEERVVSDRNSIELDLSGAWFDLELSRAVTADPTVDLAGLLAACELHRGDLMAGFALRDSVNFDDWLRDHQDGVRRERAALLDRLTAALERAGRMDDAVARARERLALDHLHEPTHRRLIELYAAAGRRGDALSQYRECVRVLDRELGVGPLAETTELYNSISAGTVAVAPLQPEPPAGGELPLIGRQPELERLLAAQAASVADGQLLVIQGESGVGKTRLAQELISTLGEAGVAVASARPHAGEQTLAYGVLATLLRAALEQAPAPPGDEARGELARLLPELGTPSSPSLEEPGARLRFLEVLSGAIASALDAGGVAFVDDLQWCDPASLEALTYLARRLDRFHFLLICAWRTDEPDPALRRRALEALGEPITLARLTAADVIELAATAGLDADAGARVFADSEGLPLFAAELISTLATGPDADRAGGIRAVLASRLDAVGEMPTQVLGAAAIIGRSFDPDDLRVASGRSEEEVAAALEELVLRGLVTERDDGYDFRHERVRALAEERISRARRRLLHRRIAGMLLGRHGHHAIVARHLEQAGDDAEAAVEYAAAGDRARSLSARAEAVTHYAAALALGHPDPAGLHESIGDVHTLRGEYDEALAAYTAAAALRDAGQTGRLEHKLGAVHERRGEWELAEHHYSEALERAGDADRAILQADRSRVAWRLGELERARALGFEALELADASGAPDAAAQANNILGLLGCGRAYLERSLELSRGLGDPSVRIAALNNLALDHANAGELSEAEALTREALELCIGQGDRHHEAALRNNLADLLHRAGQSEGAMEELKRAVTAFATIGSEGDALYPGVWSLVEW